MLGTCSKADLHGPLPVAKYFKLGKRYFIGYPYRVGALVPFISDIPHGVTDCNHKPVPTAKGPRAAAVFSIIQNENEAKPKINIREQGDIRIGWFFGLPVVKLITVAL